MEEKKSVILAENNERQRQPLEKHGGTIMRNTITERLMELERRNTKLYKYNYNYGEVGGIRKKKYKYDRYKCF